METNTGGIECIQQVISGSGTFTGDAVGYAGAEITNGGATVLFLARDVGEVGNDLKVRLVDPRPTANPSTVARMIDEGTLQITLATNAAGTAITASGQSVSDAVYAIRKHCPIRAFSTDSDPMAGTSLVPLAGGFDPIRLFDGPPSFETADDGGLFYFDQYLAQRVVQVEGVFSGAGTVSVKLVQVAPVLKAKDDTAITVYSAALSANNDFILPRLDVVLLPNMAIQVVCDLQGTVRVYVKRDGGLG